MTAYYNEIDPYAAQWLRNLIAAGHIAEGDVDERDIRDVRPDELRGYTQCHFFAGIGVWSYALRLAGWPDDRPVWTGSCPCQPFSAAGRGDGFADQRHLWPHFHHLIGQCRPPVVFGEQVASKDGLAWLDLVQADLEGTGYASSAVDLCAAGVGAPHIRQRLWWVADAHQHRCASLSSHGGATSERDAEPCGQYGGLAQSESIGQQGRSIRAAGGLSAHGTSQNGIAGELGHPHHQGPQACERETILGAGRREEGRAIVQSGGAPGGVEHPSGLGRQWREAPAPGHQHDRTAFEWSEGQHGAVVPGSFGLSEYDAGPTNGFWRDADWLLCRDGKWRPVEPGTFPLAHGAPARVGRLRAYGNAISPYPAAEVIGAYLDAEIFL